MTRSPVASSVSWCLATPADRSPLVVCPSDGAPALVTRIRFGARDARSPISERAPKGVPPDASHHSDSRRCSSCVCSACFLRQGRKRKWEGGNGGSGGGNVTPPSGSCTVEGNVVTGTGLPNWELMNFMVTDSSGTSGLGARPDRQRSVESSRCPRGRARPHTSSQARHGARAARSTRSTPAVRPRATP